MNLTELQQKLSDIFSENIINKGEIQKLLENYENTDWEKYKNINLETYNREYFYQGDDFEIIVVTWGSGQETSIHGHPKNGCFVKVLEGELCEELYTSKKRKLADSIFRVGDIRYLDDEIGYHKILNKSSRESVSLHIYSPGNYNPDTNEL
ncbi:MAG: hypothetical protein GY828_08025 [Candidatus Gracilibacteria bacterium]|nr:hypothetical protein [Candidatus Gracilibacteria bacterium]